LRIVYRSIRRSNVTMPFLVLRIAALTLLATHAWFIVEILVGIPVWGIPDFSWMFYFGSLFTQTPIIGAWSALYFAVNALQDWRREKRRAEAATDLARSAELQMLRYQLNPHFLFNALTSIRALIEEDKERARLAITELAEFLRYSIIGKSTSLVPLRDELEAVAHYLAIQSIRYEERLKVSTNVTAEAGEFMVLSFLIQPLVENALKYGMQTSAMPLSVELNAAVHDETLVFSIVNSGKWVMPAPPHSDNAGTGTGLANIRQRLEHAFPHRHQLIMGEQDGKVRVEIQIRRS
jgi:two-component system, LytTR family, sensor kinase